MSYSDEDDYSDKDVDITEYPDILDKIMTGEADLTNMSVKNKLSLISRIDYNSEMRDLLMQANLTLNDITVQILDEHYQVHIPVDMLIDFGLDIVEYSEKFNAKDFILLCDKILDGELTLSNEDLRAIFLNCVRDVRSDRLVEKIIQIDLDTQFMNYEDYRDEFRGNQFTYSMDTLKSYPDFFLRETGSYTDSKMFEYILGNYRDMLDFESLFCRLISHNAITPAKTIVSMVDINNLNIHAITEYKFHNSVTTYLIENSTDHRGMVSFLLKLYSLDKIRIFHNQALNTAQLYEHFLNYYSIQDIVETCRKSDENYSGWN